MVTEQAVKKGYKQTELGIIPEDWDIYAIKQVAAITTGSRNTQDQIPDGVYPFFVRSQVVERINSFSYDGEAVLTAGDGVGTGKVFHYINGKFDFHQRVYKISDFGDKLDGYFFYLYFSNNFHNRIMQMTAKSSVDSVRMEMIADMRIPLPKKDEQIAIAAVLSDTDALIESLDKLIAKKKAIKQGAMQQLLTGKKRLPGFSGHWELQKLGDIAEILKGQGLSKGKLSLSGEYPCILYGELFTTYGEKITKVYSKTDSREGRLSKQGDILIPGSTTTTGIDLAKASALLKTGVLLGSDINIIRQSNNSYDPTFVAYSLTHIYKNAIVQKTKGITIYHLHGKDLLDLEIKMPDLAEQTAISNILADMDAEIEALAEKREKCSVLKQGMMQQLLTGKIRIYANN